MYEAGWMDDRVTVMNRRLASSGAFGRTGGEYQDGATYWANVTQTKGMQSLREGTMDAYYQIMVRMRWHADIDADTRLRWNGKVWQQTTPPMINKKADEIQIVAQEVMTTEAANPGESSSR